jgi:Na+/proline symporter
MYSVLCAATTNAKLIQLLILIIYVAMMVAVAYYCRKKASNVDDYLLGGRGINGWMSAFSYGTAYFSAVIFVGYAGKFGWSFGLSSTLIGVGNAVFGTYLAWKVLGKRTRSITRGMNARTLPEFFEKRYEDKHIRKVTCIIIFVFLIPYSTSVYQGLAYLFEALFDIDFIWCIIMMATVTALYLFFRRISCDVTFRFRAGNYHAGGCHLYDIDFIGQTRGQLE